MLRLELRRSFRVSSIGLGAVKITDFIDIYVVINVEGNFIMLN